ncbi:MAG: alpha-amylase family protein [Planctomycetota bacterium]
MRRAIVTAWATAALLGLCGPAMARDVRLANEHIAATLRPVGGAYRLVRIARTDGSDALEIDSDEFEILLLDDSRFTVAQYRVVEEPRAEGGRIDIRYVRKADVDARAPRRVTVRYSLADGPSLHKTVTLDMEEGDSVDRLQVLRFSTGGKASRGGHGQPVFVGNWFFGMDYPGFYSRHSDGFEEPDFQYRWYYMIDFEGRDREFAPRKGLVSFFHFPGAAARQPDGSWGVASKRAVMGVSRTRAKNAELALLDYIAETRKPTRSYLHFNNWYSHEAKSITVESFVEKTYKPMAAKLAKYGVKLDAMVPDHGWENSKTYRRIFEAKVDASHEPLPDVATALEAAGTRLGAWVALDGTNQSLQPGFDMGYLPAYKEGFKSEFRWMSGNKRYFDILQPKYRADLRESLRFLIEDARVDYIKHDFNHNFTTQGLTQRHARERCLDVTLALLDYERELHPGIFINYTNGAWFSPFWLQRADCIWMMSGDSGGSGEWPQLSLREGATTYRDHHFHQSWANPERCPRPVIPIANFMTHGILFSKRKPFTDFKDTLHDWSNYVVMYYARGTTLKELYITLELLDDDHWKALGLASRWAVENQSRLMNTVLVGGDASKGEVYGYVSWTAERAILTVRNPNRTAARLRVPFDETVYCRVEKGRPYRARAVYPFEEPMPWRLASGTAFEVDVPGDSVMVFEVEPGAPRTARAAAPLPLPPPCSKVDGARFEVDIAVPDEEFMRFDLLIEPWAVVSADVAIDGEVAAPNRFQNGKRWTLASYDLRALRGRNLKVTGELVAPPQTRLRSDRKVTMDAWLVVDRRVDVPPRPQDPRLPLSISQQYRRLTQEVVPKTAIRVARTSADSELAKRLAAAAEKSRKRKPKK